MFSTRFIVFIFESGKTELARDFLPFLSSYPHIITIQASFLSASNILVILPFAMSDH